ncbi:STAS/SEC14 domain-containing protein [Pseudonocardia xishanensis]|uniref:SpoIIAA-like protein n=1 Tax=Pseudonocardia xishanensis TaxID=630995 RepID=A0ABP8RN04_9PSEU
MIEELVGLPHGVFGLRVGGRLTVEDYEKVIGPMVQRAREADGRLRCLIEIQADFEGLTPAAVLDDIGLGLGTVGAYDGVAVVTDRTALRTATEWAAFVVPFPMKVFPAGGREEAAQWLAALPAEARVEVALDAETGVVTAEVDQALRIEDFERLAATVDPWTREHGELRGLVLHIRRIPGWTSLGSVIRHVQFVVGHHAKIRRIALVSDTPVASTVAAAADRLVHPRVRPFAGTDLAAAQAWAAGD